MALSRASPWHHWEAGNGCSCLVPSMAQLTSSSCSALLWEALNGSRPFLADEDRGGVGGPGVLIQLITTTVPDDLRGLVTSNGSDLLSITPSLMSWEGYQAFRLRPGPENAGTVVYVFRAGGQSSPRLKLETLVFTAPNSVCALWAFVPRSRDPCPSFPLPRCRS